MKANCRTTMKAGVELITLDGSRLILLSVEFRAMMLGVISDWMAETVEETLSYYSFSDSRVGSRFGPTSRTRVVATFPFGQSCLNRTAGRRRHITSSQWSARNYHDPGPSPLGSDLSPRSSRRLRKVRKFLDLTGRILTVNPKYQEIGRQPYYPRRITIAAKRKLVWRGR